MLDQQRLESIIRRYVADASQIVPAMKRAFGTESLLLAVHEGSVPRSGRVDLKEIGVAGVRRRLKDTSERRLKGYQLD